MFTFSRTLLIFMFVFTLSSCTHLNQNDIDPNGIAQWDFDHQVQFRQTQLGDKQYLLEVIPNNNVPFDRLASFIIRKSYRLCGGYTYKLEMLKGIEEYNDKLARPHYIFSSLTARVEC